MANGCIDKGPMVVAGAMTSAGTALKALGVKAVSHSSGQLIVSTASGGYVAGTLGTIGTVVGALTSPVVLTAGGLALAGLGTYCLVSRRLRESTSRHRS